MYILVSLIVLGISFFLFRKSAGSLSPFKPNIVSLIFYYGFLLTTFVGATFSIAGFKDHYMLRGVSEEGVFYGWVMVLYAMFAVPLGMFIVMLFFRRSHIKRLLIRYAKRNIEASYFGSSAEEKILFLLTIISMLACAYVFYIIGYIPMVKMLTIDSDQMSKLRVSVTREFSGVVYIRSLLALQLMPLLSYVWFSYAFSKKTKGAKKNIHYLFFGLTFLFSINILYFNFEKSPVLWFFIGFYVLYFLLGRRIGFVLALKLFMMLLAFLVFFYKLSGVSVVEMVQFNQGPLGRLLFSQISGLFHYIDIYPDQHEFLGAASITRLVSLLGIEYSESAGRIAMKFFNPKGYLDGSSNVMSTFFMGEAWANFGWGGVVLAPIWVGVYIQTIYLFFLTSKKTPLFLALLTYLSVNTKVTSGFNIFVYNSGLIFWLFMFSFVVLLSRSRIRNYKSKGY